MKGVMRTLFFLLLWGSFSSLLADTVKIKETGEVFYGKIVYITAKELWLDVGNGRIVFKRQEVDFEYNNKMPKNVRPTISVIEVPEGEENENKPKTGKSTGGQGTSPSGSGKVTKMQPWGGGSSQGVKEQVPPDILSRMQMSLTRMRRALLTDWRKAFNQCKTFFQRYPNTMANLVMQRLDPSMPPRHLLRYLKLLKAAPKTKNMKLIELLLMKFLKHDNKRVRYATAMALNNLTGQNFEYPKPSEDLDHSITPEEEKAADQWLKWWNMQVTKQLQQQISQQQEKKQGVSQEARALLEKLKKILGEK